MGKYTNADGIADYYDADVESARDYYPFGMTQPGREYTSNSYRYGFNGKEDDKNWGVKYVQDYGFRLYNPAIGRFLSEDPLTKKYPELTPYQFESNSPVSGIDLDGLEYYYAADSKYLGQGGDPKSKEVLLGKIRKSNGTGKVEITAVDLNGKTQKQFMVNHQNINEFKKMAGKLYAEADGTTSEAVDEVAGIYSVIENRAEYENTTIMEQMTQAKGLGGADPVKSNTINLADKVGMTKKKEAVFAGIIKGILSDTDFSNGAFYWDGEDFLKGGGHVERYNPGYKFKNKDNDLWKQGDNLVKGTNTFRMGKDTKGKYRTITKSWDYKYESTIAIGKTTFSRLTESWRSVQHPFKQAKKVGNG